MKKQSLWHMFIVLQLILATATIACTKQTENKPTPPGTGEPGIPGGNGETPSTPIPADLAGTWYAADNQRPMTENWEEGSFQGEIGFKDYRTMVFTADGKNAIEYSSEVFVHNNTTLRQMYKITGTLEYKSNPVELVFHAVSGKIRVFSGEGYTESDIIPSDIAKYYSLLTDIVAAPTAFNAKRNDGANSWSVKYLRVSGTGGGSDTPPPAGAPYSKPPESGSYVQINNQYFPTVTLGSREWMAVNYYGTGGINVDGQIKYGTFYRFTDLNVVPVPAGWRIPTKADYISLLESQDIAFDPVFNTTDGSDLPTKKKLGGLMSVTGWLKQDGYETNTSGFNAVPANVQVTSGTAYGEGSNCVLWTSERDGNDQYVSFKIIQMPSDTYAAFGSYPEGFNPVYAPVRLVRDK